MIALWVRYLWVWLSPSLHSHELYLSLFALTCLSDVTPSMNGGGCPRMMAPGGGIPYLSTGCSGMDNEGSPLEVLLMSSQHLVRARRAAAMFPYASLFGARVFMSTCIGSLGCSCSGRPIW